MRTFLLAAAVMLLLSIFAVAQARRTTAPPKSSGAPVVDLRRYILERVPDETSSKPDDAFAIIMDTVHPGAVASVMSSTGGDASVYFSNGGAIIGGIGHENVRRAAKEFVHEFSKHRVDFKPVTEFPYPTGSNVRFYVRTHRAVYMAECSEEKLGAGDHALSPLYFAGQQVIAELRTVTEKGEQQ